MFESCKSNSDALSDAERILDVKVVDLWASLCEDQKMFVLAFEAIGDHKVFDAGFFCSSLEGKHIRLLLFTPNWLFVHTFLNFLAEVEVSIALVQKLQGKLYFWQVNVHSSRSREPKEVGLIANGGIAVFFSILYKRISVAEESRLELANFNILERTSDLFSQVNHVFPHSFFPHSHQMLFCGLHNHMVLNHS